MFFANVCVGSELGNWQVITALFTGPCLLGYLIVAVCTLFTHEWYKYYQLIAVIFIEYSLF